MQFPKRHLQILTVILGKILKFKRLQGQAKLSKDNSSPGKLKEEKACTKTKIS